MHRADYFASHASDEEKGKLENALRFEDLDMEDTVPITTPSGKTLPLPIKYLYITPEGKPITKSSAYAGYTIELLFRKDPAIKPLMIEARNSVDSLRKFAQAIEKIAPGLYKELQTSDYTEDNFSEKLATVVAKVVGGTEKAITAKSSLRQAWDRFL